MRFHQRVECMKSKEVCAAQGPEARTLVCTEVLSAIASVVTEGPRAVHQLLLAQLHELAGLQEILSLQGAGSAEAPARPGTSDHHSTRHTSCQHQSHVSPATRGKESDQFITNDTYPQIPWSLIGVTAPLARQSTEVGRDTSDRGLNASWAPLCSGRGRPGAPWNTRSSSLVISVR